MNVLFSPKAVVLIPLLLLCLAATSPAVPADPESPERSRPKVGLVLSGGGARGAAHVGVLRALEARQVPVDMIAGTSMGALIGVLYASGLSPDEIETLLKDNDWNTGYRDTPPREYLSFRNKEEEQDFLIDLDLGFNKGKFSFPQGVLQGQSLMQLLNRVTAHTADTDSFDDLPIPFRAVAANLETGTAVVLDKGPVSRALRASMGVPGVLSPVTIGDQLLIDGGVANNLPVDVVRAMGADIVIAVDVSTPLVNRDNLNSVLSVVDQLSSILTRQNTERQINQLTDQDILIQPELEGIATARFDLMPDAIPKGEQAVSALSAAMARVAVEPAVYNDWHRSRSDTERADVVIAGIRIDSDSRLQDSAIRDLMETQPGDTFDEAMLEQDMARIYGLDLFERVNYTLEPVGEETFLVVHANRKSWGPGYIDLGLSLEENFNGESNYLLGASYTLTELNALGAEWRTEMQIGQRPRLFSEFYQPLDPLAHNFVGLTGEISRRPVKFFTDGEAEDILDISQALIGVEIGHHFGYWGQLKAGYRRGESEVDLRVGDPDRFPDRSNRFGEGHLFASFRIDTFDNLHFPQDGHLLTAYWQASRESLGAETNYDQFRLNWSSAFGWGPHHFQWRFKAAGVDKDIIEPGTITFIGGLGNLSGLEKDQLAGLHKRLASISYAFKLGENVGPLSLPLYIGASFERGNVWLDQSDIGFGDTLKAGSLYLGMDSLLGPVFFGYGRTSDGEEAAYLFIDAAF